MSYDVLTYLQGKHLQGRLAIFDHLGSPPELLFLGMPGTELSLRWDFVLVLKFSALVDCGGGAFVVVMCSQQTLEMAVMEVLDTCVHLH